MKKLLKKMLAIVSAGIMSCSALSVSVNGAETEKITDPETICRMVRTYWASLGIDVKKDIWRCIATYDVLGLGQQPGDVSIFQNYGAGKLYGKLTRKFFEDYNVDLSKIVWLPTPAIQYLNFPDDFPTDEADYPAYREKMKAYTLGDLNENGTVQLEDAEAALAAYTAAAGQLDTGLTETQSYAADPDGNGTLTLSDAQHILRYYTVNTLGQQNVSWVDIVVFGA